MNLSFKKKKKILEEQNLLIEKNRLIIEELNKSLDESAKIIATKQREIFLKNLKINQLKKENLELKKLRKRISPKADLKLKENYETLKDENEKVYDVLRQELKARQNLVYCLKKIHNKLSMTSVIEDVAFIKNEIDMVNDEIESTLKKVIGKEL